MDLLEWILRFLIIYGIKNCATIHQYWQVITIRQHFRIYRKIIVYDTISLFAHVNRLSNNWYFSESKSYMSISNIRQHKSRFILGQSKSFSDAVRHVGLILPVGGETQTSSYGLTAKFVKRSRNKVGTQSFARLQLLPILLNLCIYSYGISGCFPSNSVTATRLTVM